MRLVARKYFYFNTFSSGYQLVEILSEKIYEDVKTFVSGISGEVFIGLIHMGGQGCSNATCGSEPGLIWENSGQRFVYEPWLAGIYYNVATKPCAVVRPGMYRFS